MLGQRIVGNILGPKIKVDRKSRNNDRNYKVGGEVSQEEYNTFKKFFNSRFPDDSFEEFAEKTNLRVKK